MIFRVYIYFITIVFIFKVIKQKKEDLQKNVGNSSLYKIIAGNDDELEKNKEELKQMSQEQFSYGQVAGLKDDLDYQDNDVGMFS